MTACFVAELSISIVLALLSNGQWQLVSAAITLPMVVVSGAAMLGSRRSAFSACIGALIVLQCCAYVLTTDLGFVGAWSALGIGLACLLVGNQALSSRALYVKVGKCGVSSAEIISATLRSFWRILLFLALVMGSSLLVLLLILALDVGSLTLPLLLVTGLMVMVSLYYLATRATTAGDEEKSNI